MGDGLLRRRTSDLSLTGETPTIFIFQVEL
jgi:hypothetical protein